MFVRSLLMEWLLKLNLRAIYWDFSTIWTRLCQQEAIWWSWDWQMGSCFMIIFMIGFIPWMSHTLMFMISWTVLRSVLAGDGSTPIKLSEILQLKELKIYRKSINKLFLKATSSKILTLFTTISQLCKFWIEKLWKEEIPNKWLKGVTDSTPMENFILI